MSWDGHDNGAPLRKLARLPTDGVHVRRLARASLSGRNLKECLFCQAPKRLKKNRRLFESLCRCTWDFTPQRNAAYVRQDEAVLLEVKHTDLHAKDVMYHMSCYKNYTCPRHLGLLSQRQVAMEDQNDDQSVASQADPASHPHNTAFQRLAQFMEMKFDADSNCVMNLTDLCQKFKELLGEEGVIVSSYKSPLLTSRISLLSFWRQTNIPPSSKV